MSKGRIRRKHAADAIQLHRISRPASPTYKEGPSSRANGRATHNTYKERYQGPHVSLPEKDKDERRPGGVGRTWPASRPGAFREGVGPKSPDYLHTCIWQEPTSTSINRAPTHPSQHTLFIPFSPRRLSSLLLS